MPTRKQLQAMAVYEAKLDDLLNIWSTGGRPLGTFSQMLVLMNVQANIGRLEQNVWLEAPMVKLYEPATKQTLLALLRECTRTYAKPSSATQTVERGIMAGLLRHDRWRSCLECQCDALAFANLSIRILGESDVASIAAQKFMTSSEKMLHQSLVDRLQSVLQEWRAPGVTVAPYDTQSLGAALFSEAWMALVFEPRPAGMTLAEMLCQVRPTFIHGVLPGPVVEALTLPDLTGVEANQ